jgi:hypothetical protein
VAGNDARRRGLHRYGPAGAQPPALGDRHSRDQAHNKSAVPTTNNRPGIPSEVGVTGVPLERMLASGPLPGTRLTAATNSHLGTCRIAINANRDAFGETELLWHCVLAGLHEI